MEDLLTLSATELAKRIRERQISPTEVLEAHIVRIEAVNPQINALVTPMYQTARLLARQAEKLLSSGLAHLPPLFGLPVTVKDALEVGGIRFTGGTKVYQDRIGGKDADAVRRFKDAGAIILGKTNCPDMSSSVETDNLVFGLTRNPWNLEHSAGGSSGGEGALIAAGGSPLGLGSDIAGSIRIPSAFCGTCGLKPTGGRVSIEGHDPPVPQSMANWNTVGPLARRVEDLALALSVLSKTPVSDYRKIDMDQRRVIIPDFFPDLPVNRGLVGAVDEAAGVLSNAGMRLTRGIKLPLYRLTFEMVAALYRDWTPMVYEDLGRGKPFSVWAELWDTWRGKGRIGSNTLAMFAQTGIYGKLTRLFHFGNFDKIRQHRAGLLEIMGDDGLILWPVYTTPAPRHGYSWGINGMPRYTPIFNMFGFPAVALPISWSKKGLPLSVQVIARPGEDEVALAAAAVLEKEFSGWRMAPLDWRSS